MNPVVSRFALALGAGVASSFAAQATSRQAEVVVTANRAPTTVDATLAGVTLISRDEIESSGSADLHDLLRGVPGLDLARSGGMGQQTSVFLRGTNSNHVLVLVDGVRVAALGTGAFAWEQLSLAQIERIEIVRGPRAALWGSDAIGGVVQIFTRRIAGSDFAVSAGNHDHYGADAGVGARSARGGFDVRAGYTEARGTNSTNPEAFNFDPDDDGFVHRNVLVHGDLALGTQTLRTVASQRDNDIEFDQGEQASRQSHYSLALDGALATNWSHHLGIAAARDRLTTPAFFSRYSTRREQADWNHTLAFAERSELSFGAAYLRERGESTDTFDASTIYDENRSNRAAFAAWRVGTGAHDFEFSGRHDDNSTFGGENTFAAAWGWQVADALRGTLSYGEGFRAPTLNELYSPGFGGLFAGNPLLDPEQSHSTEFALQFLPHADLEFEFRGYRTDIDELVDFSGGDTFQAINIKRARIDGVELEGRWDRGPWRFDANATWQDPQDLDTGAALLRRPARKANASVDYAFDGGARLGIEGFASSSRPDFGGDLPGYGLLAIRGRVPLSAGFSLDARIDNVLDRDYSLLRGYNTAGMTALLTLRWEALDR